MGYQLKITLVEKAKWTAVEFPTLDLVYFRSRFVLVSEDKTNIELRNDVINTTILKINLR